MSKMHRIILIVCTVLWTQALSFSLPDEQKRVVNETVETMMNCEFSRAFSLCDSMIRADTADPMAWMLKASAIGLHDLDCDSATDSLLFIDVFKKAELALFNYEKSSGVSSYSLTIKGFSKVIAAAYTLWQKRYFDGLSIGLDALSALKQAKKIDTANVDADCILGLYTYARAELKRRFWWMFFWYSGDKEGGIRKIKVLHT